ncbi:phage portal protein [Geodermatophilus sp. DSM 45219]|uniref:phage portal protein n=1 Tax=Geodermatophilus sp. DSM 45219 TaxID=1881103 RepID=UPI000887FA44|nr:phage portal protein [Geodermatophilus sp. DSM 45219]SDN79287.1 Phage portal protein, SPP1 Gp6-like [Geodermatophilus sp. DSM 45219]
MNTEKLTLPGLSDDENATLNRLLDELNARQPRNILRASYYDGKRAIKQVGTVIPPQYYNLGLVLGWSAKAVDGLARRCNHDRMVWADGDLGSLGMDELAEANNLKTELNGAILASLQHGPAFLINTEGDASIGEPSSLIHVKDALNATGDWNPRTRRLDNLLSIIARDDKGNVTAFALYLPNMTISAEKDSSGWQIDRAEHSWGVPAEVFPYKPLPRRPFGASRISRPIMSLHDQGLRTVIRMEGHMDVYSFPQLWLMGADGALFKNADGSQKAAWQMMLGRIFGVPDNEDPNATHQRADIKQIDAASPEPHLAHLNALAKQFAREASLPDTSVAITDMANPTSAEAYDASQHELIAEAEGATDDWTPALRRSVVRGLAIQNGLTEVPRDWRTITPKWRNPRFISSAAQADAGQKLIASVPWLAETEVGLEKLGLTEQEIKRAMADRRRNAGRQALRDITARAQATQTPDQAPVQVSDDDADVSA